MGEGQHVLGLRERGCDGFVGRIEFPSEWLLGRSWRLTEIVSSFTLSGGGDAFIAGGVLDDETNLVGLCWPEGQYVMRSIPPDGHVEQRASGDDSRQGVREMWAQVVDAILAADAELREDRR